jgi:hypothetical protein
MYILSMRFDKSQFLSVNMFIQSILNKQSYIVKNNVVMNGKVYSVFSSVLERPEIDMTFNDRKDAIDFVYSLVGLERGHPDSGGGKDDGGNNNGGPTPTTRPATASAKPMRAASSAPMRTMA